MLQVKMEDRKGETALMDVMIRSLGIDIPYTTIDLIQRGLAMLKEKGGSMTIHDSVAIKSEWEKHWDCYFSEQNALVGKTKKD